MSNKTYSENRSNKNSSRKITNAIAKTIHTKIPKTKANTAMIPNRYSMGIPPNLREVSQPPTVFDNTLTKNYITKIFGLKEK